MKLYKYNQKTMQFDKVKTFSAIKYVFIISVLFSLVGFSSAVKVNTLIEKIPVLIQPEEELQFSEEWLLDKFKQYNIMYPEFTLKQAKLESGNFTSNVFKQNNNIFGFKQAQSRPTTAIGTQFNHAFYESIDHCILDMALWQTSYCKGLNYNQYRQLVGEIYSETGDYLNRVDNVK